MGVQDVFHPAVISKRHILYRAWRLMHTNRLWSVRIPDKQHICLWFWPALFAALIFSWVYPLLLTLRFTVKYIIGKPAEAVLWVVVMALYWVSHVASVVGRLATPVLQTPVGSRMTIGSLAIMAFAVALCVTPYTNHWFTGIVTTMLVSYLVVDFFFRAAVALFKAIKTVAQVAMQQWYGTPLGGKAQYTFALTASVVIAILAMPIVWFTGPALVTMATLFVMVLAVSLLVIIIKGVQRIGDALDEEDVASSSNGSGSGKKQKRQSVVAAYLSAVFNGVCPEVRFVDAR